MRLTMGVRREWLLRCSDSYADSAVCEVSVSAGTVEIAGPEGPSFTLAGAQMREFRDALNAAIDQSDDDLHAP
ncbi:hypothetical protein ACFWN2_28535 [Lentzea sp. NPDC058436]|uniref:hypothetical protein n=1 Tax=Lentzea sp. NPDC058436 TaxID=3346499 RepID=UPI003661DB6F